MTAKTYPEPRKPDHEPVDRAEELLPYARKIVNDREGTITRYFTTGYGGLVEAGDRVLIAVRNLHNEQIVEAIARAFRENGVLVDVVEVDIGPDGERTETMDVDLAITDPAGELDVEGITPSQGEDTYSNFLGKFWWTEELAVERGYDLLIQSTAGAFSYRYPKAHLEGEPIYMERLPWQTTEGFVSDGTFFPKDLLLTIARRTRELIWEHGEGATVHITDPEGTDITYTLWPEYFENTPAGTKYSQDEWDEQYGSFDMPLRQTSTGAQGNHIAVHPKPPLIEKEDASGVIVSTLGHHSKPYPKLTLQIEDGVVTDIEGGGGKGKKLREIHERTKDIEYPDYPRPGLFWMWEVSLCTNPKIVRPDDVMKKSEPGNLTERLRSGYVHIGTGTRATTVSEDWADEEGIPYGHTDQHLNFPTIEFIKDGEENFTLVDKGHLVTLDDQEVREVAAERGDPDELLVEDWIPPIPGVNVQGDYDEYARNPAEYIDKYDYER